MVKLFVARDAGGQHRYIGDVPRGVACGCFCLVCSSPLVARKGDLLEWHFAHEASQERPECPAGAANLLRRLAVEEFVRTKGWPTHPFAVPHPQYGRPPITWTAQAAGVPQIVDAVDGPDQPSARVALSPRGSALVHVCIGREPDPSFTPTADGDVGVIVLRCPLPRDGEIRSEEQARAFVRSHADAAWLYLPDVHGRLEAARAEHIDFLRRTREDEARRAGARWAGIRQRMLDGQHSSPDLPNALQLSGPAPAAAKPPAAPVPAWAPGMLPRTSVHLRELNDGTRWVCYQDAPNSWRLRQVPEPQDGWDEMFPPTMAVPEGADWLRVVNFDKLLAFFNRTAVSSEITSDTAHIERRFLER